MDRLTRKPRTIVNEAQRLLIGHAVTLGQLASTTERSRQAASGWMSGKTKPDKEARERIAGRWTDVGASLWEVVPKTEAPSAPSSPAPLPPPSSDKTFRELILDHASAIDRDLMEAKGLGRQGDAIKLMGLKQKVLMDGAKFTGELTAAEESRLTKSNRFVQIRTAIAKALGPYPDAGRAVEEALRALDA